MVKFEGRYRRRKRGGWIAEASLVSTCRVGSRGGKQRRCGIVDGGSVGGSGGGGWHRRGSIHGSSPVPGHPSTTVSASSISSSAAHEVQTRGIPLPGMVPSRSIHASPMHGNPIHGFVNPLGPGGLVHPPPPTHVAVASGISHHPNVHQGTEKILPPGSPYSSHGSPLRTPMSSGHGSPQDSPHVARHRRDSEHSSGAISRRGSSDVVSPLPEGHPLGSPDGRGRRRSDYSPHQAVHRKFRHSATEIDRNLTSTPLKIGTSLVTDGEKNRMIFFGRDERLFTGHNGHLFDRYAQPRIRKLLAIFLELSIIWHGIYCRSYPQSLWVSFIKEYISIRTVVILVSVLFGDMRSRNIVHIRCILKVTKLREHWDETNSKVMQRKTQLDMMLGDSQRYEAKRNEVEVWLARMETRLEKMRAVGHTADVLEAQLREQKFSQVIVVSSSSRFACVFICKKKKLFIRRFYLDALCNSDRDQSVPTKLLVEALFEGLTLPTYRGSSAKEARLLLTQYEAKSFHAELHQYKHHIELFNQLTQKLIAVYQQDDTTRVKKMTETINQRYNNLNMSIINRGKLLHSAMNSLHNFDRSLDKFLAWLSEAESSMEGLEAEADRLGGRRDQGALRRPQHQLKVRLSRSHKFHDKFRHGIFW
ncbi:Dystrophin, isoforms A/C/F/G/H [Trachymyrmex septentrionalis]|uniref:Dystrophin, isoforms A/C/F/G/H n=1 Tax=Trachymyrmex septentrionalis TaxID=34720 RepID=A0A195EYR6_9HYME|nr:Dystrophin, isoforms A/C/F/G/H [Trachymyrmex septentrionalis]